MLGATEPLCVRVRACVSTASIFLDVSTHKKETTTRETNVILVRGEEAGEANENTTLLGKLV